MRPSRISQSENWSFSQSRIQSIYIGCYQKLSPYHYHCAFECTSSEYRLITNFTFYWNRLCFFILPIKAPCISEFVSCIFWLSLCSAYGFTPVFWYIKSDIFVLSIITLHPVQASFRKKRVVKWYHREVNDPIIARKWKRK